MTKPYYTSSTHLSLLLLEPHTQLTTRWRRRWRSKHCLPLLLRVYPLYKSIFIIWAFQKLLTTRRVNTILLHHHMLRISCIFNPIILTIYIALSIFGFNVGLIIIFYRLNSSCGSGDLLGWFLLKSSWVGFWLWEDFKVDWWFLLFESFGLGLGLFFTFYFSFYFYLIDIMLIAALDSFE